VLYVEITLEAGPSVLYDAVVVPDGKDAVQALSRDAHAQDFVREQYRHCKPLLVLGAGAGLLKQASVPPALPDGSPDPALIGADGDDLAPAIAAFKKALAGHRAFARETDPPMV
jgi:catalase